MIAIVNNSLYYILKNFADEDYLKFAAHPTRPILSQKTTHAAPTGPEAAPGWSLDCQKIHQEINHQSHQIAEKRAKRWLTQWCCMILILWLISHHFGQGQLWDDFGGYGCPALQQLTFPADQIQLQFTLDAIRLKLYIRYCPNTHSHLLHSSISANSSYVPILSYLRLCKYSYYPIKRHAFAKPIACHYPTLGTADFPRNHQLANAAL